MNIKEVITLTDVPEGAVLRMQTAPGRDDTLLPVRHAVGGVWVLNGRGPEQDGWCFYKQTHSD